MSATREVSFVIALDLHSGRIAKVTLPVPITDRDLTNLAKWIAYVRTTMLPPDTDPSNHPLPPAEPT